MAISRKPVASIKIPPRFRQDSGDLSALRESIRQVGLLHPVVISKDGVLIGEASSGFFNVASLCACDKGRIENDGEENHSKGF